MKFEYMTAKHVYLSKTAPLPSLLMFLVLSELRGGLTRPALERLGKVLSITKATQFSYLLNFQSAVQQIIFRYLSTCICKHCLIAGTLIA